MVDEKKMRANFLIDIFCWETFVNKCLDQDSDASKELRKFIKRYNAQ
jgi:hypothetical protein